MNNSPLEPRLSLRRGFCCKSAVLELLDSFSDQLVKLLRLRGERLHPVLSELRLKRQNLLEILCLGDLFDQRESLVGILLRDFRSAALHILKSCGQAI